MDVQFDGLNVAVDPTSETVAKPTARVQSSLRLQYEAQVEVLKGQIGDLEKVRDQLGLSQRKMCQLLMVDPSAWTRWTKSEGEKAPPHIWRALQWYLILQNKIPGLTPEYFLGAREAGKNRPEFSEFKEFKSKLSQMEVESILLNKKIKSLKSYLFLSLFGFLGPWLFVIGRALYFKYF